MILCYARVSTVEQAMPGTVSPGHQLKKAREIAILRDVSSHQILEYRDDGVSGSMPLRQRPAGKRMIDESSRGDTIIASKMDRLFRSALDALHTAEWLKESGIDLILADISIEPVTSSGVGKFFFGLMAQVAEFERDRIRERLAEGRVGKRLRGGSLGGPQAPYGYCVVRDEQAKEAVRSRSAMLAPVESEQKVIDLVEHLHDHHANPYKITKELHAQGLLTRTGKCFQVVQVQRILDGLAWRDRVIPLTTSC